ncbi:MAG TPA: type III PLP-dependent enzyme [Candidatus Pelagibacter sp.]|jgi:ornithine decarboxylase|nr:type III PLP-dependent enzyme [Candidatus Pelagibacter sp.]
MQKFNSVDELVNSVQPVDPIYCIRPNSIKSACGWFKDNFPGKILYAVKTNPNEKVIKCISESGINRFDVASINEIKLIKKILPKAYAYYMNTVKNREHIREAYLNYNIRDFALDTKEELQKIIEETNGAKDLTLYIRVSISNEHAEIDLSKKFGALPSEALGLLRLAKAHAKKVGLSFHVGSQCMHPISYAKGIREVGNIIKKTKIIPDIINIGGGFPSVYPDLNPQPLQNYIDEIKKAFNNLKLENKPELLCEPGRALVAESGSTIVKVILRKKQKIYINDGTYGSLFDAGVLNFVLPTRMIPNGRITSKKLTSYSLYGPTCDSADYMKGPFVLPNNLKEGDYIEIGQLGAYSLTFRTRFNGFYSDKIFEVQDKPIMSVYEKDSSSRYLVA